MKDARPWRNLYNAKQWHRLRSIQLRDEPLCRMCAQENRVTAAQIVDHVIPHKGNEALFFDSSNLQSLCKPHHDSAKQKAESRGVLEIGSTASGEPLDPNHHWNK